MSFKKKKMKVYKNTLNSFHKIQDLMQITQIYLNQIKFKFHYGNWKYKNEEKN